MEDSSTIARKTWELENNIPNISVSDDIFHYDDTAQAKIKQEKPWTSDPNYFKHVQISALALLKMVVHARSGGNIEITGFMLGKSVGDTIFVMDVFALPVEGIETTIKNPVKVDEYITEYMEANELVGRFENVIGWYHSHPGYGVWLSGADVARHMGIDPNQEPFLAVVIDPLRTVSAGKVEIGAFRTYPKGHNKISDDHEYHQKNIPLDKIDDFRAHCKQYYSLDITYFKSSLHSHILDSLWNKYWFNTLSSSPLLGNRDYVAGQISDLAEKLEQAEDQLDHSPAATSQLANMARDSAKLTVEQVHGLMSQVIKDILFNSTRDHQSNTPSSDPS